MHGRAVLPLVAAATLLQHGADVASGGPAGCATPAAPHGACGVRERYPGVARHTIA